MRFAKTLIIDRPVLLKVAVSARIRARLECSQSSFIAAEDVRLASCSEVSILQGGLISLGQGVEVGSGSRLSVTRHQIKIDNNTTFYSNVSLLGEITIGRDCIFAANITILTNNHVTVDRRPIRIQDAEYFEKHGELPNAPVKIGNDVWVGMNVIILPGVVLGDGCVVGAGSVVTKSFEAYSVIAGVPARLIRFRGR